MPALPDLRIESPADHRDALVLALQAVLRWHGADVPYDTLASVTGIAAIFAATDREACPLRWQDDGRDAFLVDAAEQFGLSIRDLHPPDAAPLPITPPEFELHWIDSYVPLVEASLAHGQPVLAWMGWPAPNETQWGIINAIDARTRVCRGVIAGVNGAVVFERAAVQAYVVQDFTRTRDPDAALLASAVTRSRSILNNELPAKFGIITGPEALRRMAAVRGNCNLHRRPASNCIRDALSTRAARRTSFANYFKLCGLTDMARVASESAAVRTTDDAIRADERLARALEKVAR